MKIADFQGTALSPAQRERMAIERRVKAFMAPVLADQVKETLQVLDQRKDSGAKPEKVWELDYQVFGTLCIAEYMDTNRP